MVLHSALLGTLLCLLAAAAQAQTSSPSANLPSANLKTILDRMAAAQRENKARIHPLTVKRGYLLRDKKDQEKARVIANITVLPPGRNQYEIESSSGGMGEKVLRDILNKETEPRKEEQRAELSSENYEFQLLGEDALDGRRCYLLSLNPRRDEKDLLRGRLWVDAETYNILRIEGKAVKNPSWWIRDLYILMSFAEVDGMWMRTFMRAAADVRFKGEYVMEARDINYRAAKQTGSGTRRNPGILAGSVLHP